MHPKSRSRAAILEENADLHGRLAEAEAMLRAIRNGEAGAVAIQTTGGRQDCTHRCQDAESTRVRGEMLAQVSDAVIALDRAERITYLNAAAERLYGVAISKAIGRGWWEIFEVRWPHPDDEAAARAILRERGVWRGENVLVTRDGRELNVESGVSLLSDSSGRAAGFLAVIRDVTERKQDEAKVLVSEIRYRRLFETAHDGILILDPATRRIIDANPIMTQMLGCTHGQLVGKQLFEIGLLGNEAASQGMFRRLIRAKRVRYESLPIEGQGGRQQQVEVVANLYDENGQPVIQCNIRDITARKRSEEHVLLLIAEVNHRAKNLLAVVQAVAHQTAKYGDPATFAARLCDRIDGLAASQDLLVKNLWNGVSIADLVEVQLAHFSDLIGTRVIVDGPRLQLTMAAAQGIGMALHELTTNAAKYGALSNAHGQVRIAWQALATAAGPTFSMSWREDGGPTVAAPTRQGFGQTVIGPMAEAAVDGIVEIDFRESGLSWTLSAPVANVLVSTAGRPQ